MSRRYCLEPLHDDAPPLVARCTRRYGVEHSHQDLTARQAVDAGVARVGECLTAGHHSRDFHKSTCLVTAWSDRAWWAYNTGTFRAGEDYTDA